MVEYRVDVVRDHHHGHPLLVADPPQQGGDGALVRQVEAVQRLVEQQQSGPTDERLGDQQPLLLAARTLPDRPPRVGGRADQLDDLGHAVLCRPPLRGAYTGQRDPPPVAVQAEPDDVDAADAQARVEAAALGQVAHLGAAVPGPVTEHPDLAGGGRKYPEQHLDQCGLADPVGAEDGGELPGPHGQIDPRPQGPPAHPHGRATQREHRTGVIDRYRDRRHGGGPGRHGVVVHEFADSCDRVHGHLPVACFSASAMPCSSLVCQSWKVELAGASVSVTVATGMPCALAAATWAATSGVEFWLL